MTLALPASFNAFFGPRAGATVGAGSSGAVADAHAGIPVERLDHSIPLPHDAPDDWDTVYVSEIPLPPVGTGFAKLVCAPKVKVDKKAATGAPKPKVTTTGGEAIEGTITVHFVQEALPAMVAAAETLYPGSGPFSIRHPKAKMSHLSTIEIVAWGDAPDPDQFGEFTWVLHYLQVSLAAQNNAGGSAVSTAKKAKPAEAGDTGATGATAAEGGAALAASGAADPSLARKVKVDRSKGGANL